MLVAWGMRVPIIGWTSPENRQVGRSDSSNGRHNFLRWTVGPFQIPLGGCGGVEEQTLYECTYIHILYMYVCITYCGAILHLFEYKGILRKFSVRFMDKNLISKSAIQKVKERSL